MKLTYCIVTEPNYRSIISVTVNNRKISLDFCFIMRKKPPCKDMHFITIPKHREHTAAAVAAAQCSIRLVYTFLFHNKQDIVHFEMDTKDAREKKLVHKFSFSSSFRMQDLLTMPVIYDRNRIGNNNKNEEEKSAKYSSSH